MPGKDSERSVLACKHAKKSDRMVEHCYTIRASASKESVEDEPKAAAESVKSATMCHEEITSRRSPPRMYQMLQRTFTFAFFSQYQTSAGGPPSGCR